MDPLLKPDLHTQCLQVSLGGATEGLRKRREYSGTAFDQRHARLLGVDVAIVPGQHLSTQFGEGSGQFFATQGEDKCALDSVTQVPVPGDATLYRLEGRGYCTQPARRVGGDGSVLVSRFDVVAIVPGSTR